MYRTLVEWGRRGRRRMADRLPVTDRDRGAGFVEYAGLLLLIAGIVVAVMALGLDNTIADAIGNAVSSVIGG